jgi:cytochrome P450
VVTEGRKYDLYSQDFFADAYATFAQMREHDPVFSQPGLDGETPIWWVTRYEDAEAVLLDDERFVRDPRLALAPEVLAEFTASLPDAIDFVDSHMLNRDGDDHRRLRRLVSKAFTPRMIEQLRPRIQEIANELLDPVVGAGEMELVSTFAFPLPITVIAELLGVPPADRDQFREWSDAFVRPAIDAAELERFGVHMVEFVAYLHALFEERRSEPRDDLTSALVAVEDGGDTLSEHELSSMVALLIVAGHETTVSLIGNATLALLTHPEQRAAVESDPALLPRAVEELIRYDGPVERTLNRWAAVRRGAARTDDSPRRVGDRHPRLGRPRPRAVREAGHARPGVAARQPAPRVRPRQPLLPRCAACAARDRDRARDAAAPPARLAPCNRAGRAELAAGPALPQSRRAAGRLGRPNGGVGLARRRRAA